MARAPELFEASFFGVCQLARSAVFNREYVPGGPFGNDTFSGFPQSTMLMQAATVGPTVRPSPFIAHNRRELGTHFKHHAVEGRGCLEVGNTAQHDPDAGGTDAQWDYLPKLTPASG